jgi:hypothetical protein
MFHDLTDHKGRLPLISDQPLVVSPSVHPTLSSSHRCYSPITCRLSDDPVERVTNS